MEFGLDLVIIDYLQLMSSETRNDNRVQEVSYISRALKQLARELNVPWSPPRSSRALLSSAPTRNAAFGFERKWESGAGR